MILSNRAPFEPRTVLADKSGRTVFESLLIVFFLAFLLFIAVDRFTSSVKPVKEAALTVELANLRSAINFFAMTKGRLPASLKELIAVKAVAPKSDIEGRDYRIEIIGSYVQSMTADPEGYPTDPFGNRYDYDPKTGRVRSTTKGYEQW